MPRRHDKTDYSLPPSLPHTSWLAPHEEERAKQAWLGLGDATLIPTTNILSPRSVEDIENPTLHLLSILRDPKNFGLTCSALFNRTLSPMQTAIMWELWNRPFPMLIGSRGLSKSWTLAMYVLLRALFCQGSKIVIVGAAFRQSKVVFDYAAQIWSGAHIFRDMVGPGCVPRRENDRCSMQVGESMITALPLGTGEKIRGQRASIIIAEEFACLGPETLIETDIGLLRIGDCESRLGTFRLRRSDGEWVEPDRYIKTPPVAAYRVKTRNGYEFTCSERHQVLTTKGWKLAKDLTKSDYLIHKSSDHFPDEEVVEDGIRIDEEAGWLLGTLVAEGTVSGRYTLDVHSTDLATVHRAGAALGQLSANKVGYYDREAYTDPRGWECKESYQAHVCDVGLRDKLERMGLHRATARFKTIPDCILRSPKRVVLAFLSGLFDGDGSAFLWRNKGHQELGISFYSSSEQLAKEVHQLLHKFGIVCYRTKRKSNISPNPQWMVRLNGRYAHAFAGMVDVPRWGDVAERARPPRIPKHVSKAGGKWNVYHSENGKTKYGGRYDTQVEAEAAAVATAPEPHLKVSSVQRLPGEHVLYDFHVPDGNEFLGGCFVQHNSVPREIFENVVAGFGAVSLSPIEKMQSVAYLKELQRMGKHSAEVELPTIPGLNSNQLVISGTAYYRFNHFYHEWSKYKAIIESRGDRKRLEEIFNGEVPDRFNWRDYSIVRVPVELVPEGFMDDKNITRAKLTYAKTQYLIEFGAVFPTDSDGYYPRSLIETCVVGKPENPIVLNSAGAQPIRFSAALRGDPQKRYVIGVDPASEVDNFAIVVLEMWPDHRRIVHCWTINRKRHKRRLDKNLVPEHDYFAYVSRRVRDLCVLFPCARIVLDKQGGGVAVLEALADPDNLLEGEVPILEVIDPEKEKRTDRIPGSHIIEIASFGKEDWAVEANTGMKYDFESKTLLFPSFDAASVGLAAEEDLVMGRVEIGEDGDKEILYDTMESCVLNIEELKDELASIIHFQVGTTGRDRWDTPEGPVPKGKKKTTRKDRYSALLMANSAARAMSHVQPRPQYYSTGGFASDLKGRGPQPVPKGHLNPQWYDQAVGGKVGGGGVVVRRGRR